MIKHNYLIKQYEKTGKLRINHNYLREQFSDFRKIFEDLEKLIQDGDYTLGKPVNEFEKNFSKMINVKYAIGVNSGTDALTLSLKALDVGYGNEVITTPNTFIATVGAIVDSGAKPIFVDVREDYNINPDLIEEKITEMTRAIIPVHLTGRPADLGSIIKIADKHNLYVIEDAAQAIGAKYKGQKVGSFGITGCFSLHPLKNLNVIGDAGVITTNDHRIYDKLLKLRNHGLRDRDVCDCFGYNSRMDAIHAAIANLKLKYIDKWNKRHREIASFYIENLKESVPVERDYEEPVYHRFIIRHSIRNELQEYLLKEGIETKVHYPIPIHLQPAAKYLGYKKGDFPIAEEQANTILSIPLYPQLTIEQLDFIVNKIRNFVYK